ncbi:hypothetical protein GSU68_17625 [Rathayibacter sp. VKM Ac-2759]|nr:hypothetical protein GSU68_17625 [Rathayibacter sp. VKM Ac-2759]
MATTSPVYWSLQIVLGVAFLALAIARRRPRPAGVVAAVAVTGLAAAAFVGAYGLF